MTTRSKMKEAEQGTDDKAKPITFQGIVVKLMGEAANTIMALVKHDTGKGGNTARLLAELYMWNWIRKSAEAKYDALLERAKEEGQIAMKEGHEPGSYIAAESRHFVATVSVTEPVRRFNADALAKMLHEKYDIPVMLVKEMIGKAKVPTKGQERLTITERE